MSLYTGKIVGMINKEKSTEEEMGRWTSVRIEGDKKKMQIITIYRIPDSSQPGILKSKAQYDRIKGEVRTAKRYRDDMLNELSAEVQKAKDDGVDGVIIGGDFNQNIDHPQIQRFMRENGLSDLHQEVTDSETYERDRTYKNGSNQIDAILATEFVSNAVRGSKMIDFDEIIITDHRGFLFDIDFNDYFNLAPSTYDRIETRRLNPANRKHRIEFKETLETYLTQMKVLERANAICTNRVTAQEMNELDDMITYVLTVARKKVEGNKRNVPYSKLKQVKYSTTKYIKALIRKKQGKQIDEGALKRRKEYCNLSLEEMSIPALQDRYTEAIEEWKQFQKEEIKKKEENQLNLYPVEIAGDSEEIKKKRRKALESVKRKQYRQHTYDRLSKGVGKGNKKSLKRVREVNDNGDVIREMQDRESIERAISHHNVRHFRQAFTSKAYKDRIYWKLSDDAVRDKIINGNLEVDECDDGDVYKFLELLKTQRNGENNENGAEISREEWERVVTKAKKKSASSIFSNRTYSVYKCALDSKIMTDIFVLYYSTLIRKGFYLKRWLKVLDVILEKGKGPVLGKLRTIQLIEADLQLLMRIYIGERNSRNIEDDSRLSKFNYGSRANYSIETAILEKRLMYDAAVRDGKPMIHNISDLKACYDRQLPNIGCMVQEAVGVNREASKVFAKVLPIMQHHVCTDFGISKNFYGSKVEKLGGTGQGNSVSGAICRDTSCLIFKYLEDKNLGAMLKDPISKEIIQRIAIAFVDDTDFYTNGPNYEQKMQLIMDMYTQLYEATGGKIQQAKIMFYCWKWVYYNGNQKILQLEASIKVHGEIIKEINVNQSTRTLGVHLTPALNWKGQFEVMRKKMHQSITSIMNMDINAFQASIYFNVYMIKAVFFGCGVIELNPKEEVELKRIYEEPMLIKLGLSRKFPRVVLYMRKSALGIGLMAPSTIIAILKLKQYIGHSRKRGNAGKAIQMQEEYRRIEAGRRIQLGENPKHRYWKKTWIDEVSDELWKRNMVLGNPSDSHHKETRNKTVMQYAIEYVEQAKLNKDILKQINYVRLKKGVLLPVELVGEKGRKQTICYSDINERSSIDWDFNKVVDTEINAKQNREWTKFIRWMRNRPVETFWDFKITWRWTISDDQTVIKINNENEEGWYRRASRKENRFVKFEPSGDELTEKGCIGRVHNDGSVGLISIEKMEDDTFENDSEHEIPEEILQSIRNRTAVAATDASMKGINLATHWILTNKTNTIEITGGIHSAKWSDGQIPAGEGLGLLALIKFVTNNTKNEDSGEICIYNDNKKLIREIGKEIEKGSQCTQEAGAVVEGIRRELQRSKVTIKVEYANDKIRANQSFEQQAGNILMKRCDEESKRKCNEMLDNENECTIKEIGINTPIVNGKIRDKNINVLVREVDALKHEIDAAKVKAKERWEWIDVKARNCFHGGAGIGTIKCAAGYNQHGKRNGCINKGLVDTKCPRCGVEEDWEHVILCESINDLKSEYLTTLKSEMDKVVKSDEEKHAVQLIINDLVQYVRNGSQEYATTQHLVGMSVVFKGWVVKNWLNIQEPQRYWMHVVNKIIVKQSVMFYSRAWSHRNEVMHDKDIYRKYMIKWYERIVEEIEKGDKPDMKIYVRNQKLDLEKSDTGYVRLWNLYTTKMMKKARRERTNDIRNYFSVR